jgi:hypothetical protein
MNRCFFIADLIACSTCFGHHYAHNQELESIIQMVAATGSNNLFCLTEQITLSYVFYCFSGRLMELQLWDVLWFHENVLHVYKMLQEDTNIHKDVVSRLVMKCGKWNKT